MRRSIVPYALLLVFFIILISTLFSSLIGNQNTITLGGFLDWIENYHPAIGNLSFNDLTIHGDWGIFDGFKNFLNVLMNIFSFLVYICGALVNAISYIAGLVHFLFVA